MATPEQNRQLQELSDDYTSLQNELQTTVAARQRLESQQQENLSVQKEFLNLDDDSNVYKLVGPILLKQDLSEAKSTVDGRLDFIDKEIKRIEKQITDIQNQSEEKKMAVFQLQSEMQGPAQA